MCSCEHTQPHISVISLMMSPLLPTFLHTCCTLPLLMGLQAFTWKAGSITNITCWSSSTIDLAHYSIYLFSSQSEGRLLSARCCAPCSWGHQMRYKQETALQQNIIQHQNINSRLRCCDIWTQPEAGKVHYGDIDDVIIRDCLVLSSSAQGACLWQTRHILRQGTYNKHTDSDEIFIIGIHQKLSSSDIGEGGRSHLPFIQKL